MKELAESGIGYAILPFAYFRHEYAAGRLAIAHCQSKIDAARSFSHRINTRST